MVGKRSEPAAGDTADGYTEVYEFLHSRSVASDGRWRHAYGLYDGVRLATNYRRQAAGCGR